MSIKVGDLSDNQKAVLQRLLESREVMTVGMMKIVLENARKGASQRTLAEALSQME